jgi:hypothetical protein
MADNFFLCRPLELWRATLQRGRTSHSGVRLHTGELSVGICREISPRRIAECDELDLMKSPGPRSGKGKDDRIDTEQCCDLIFKSRVCQLAELLGCTSSCKFGLVWDGSDAIRST